MKALRFSAFGDPSTLVVADVADPVVGDGSALVRVEAASVNPSDVKNVAGAMRQTTLPRIPGRDYAGIVERGPPEWVGAHVWGSGGDVGFTRDGTHAELIAVPTASLSRMPGRLSFAQAASVGVNFLIAWLGLVEAAALREGEVLLIIGASGGVGGAVAQIGRERGATVIGADRAPPHRGAAILDCASVILTARDDLPTAVRDANGGKGADVVYDCVGGRAMFSTAVGCLGLRGRLIEISATGGADVSFDLADFYHNEGRLFGVDSLKHDLVRSAGMLGALKDGFESGTYRPSPIAATFPLRQAADAYEVVKVGSPGRVVLEPRA